MSTCTYTLMHMPDRVWRSEDYLWDLFSFLYVSFRDQIQFNRLVSKCFYLLSLNIAGPKNSSFIYKYIYCMCECLHRLRNSTRRKGWWILWHQSYRQLWAIVWTLGYSEHVSPGNADLGTCRERLFNYSLIQASVQFIVPYMFPKCVMILFHVDNGI